MLGLSRAFVFKKITTNCTNSHKFQSILITAILKIIQISDKIEANRRYKFNFKWQVLFVNFFKFWNNCAKICNRFKQNATYICISLKPRK